jgi:urease accessory protein
VIVNTAGGVAGGDSLQLHLSVDENARLTVTTAAAEKIYRSLGADAVIDVHLKVDPGATLAWLPQETILFDQARLRRTIRINVAKDAQLVFAETVVFGRTGRGEEVAHGRLIDRWHLYCEGRLLHAESLRLDGAIARKLAQRAVTAGNVAIATVLIYPGDEMIAEALRAQKFCGEVGLSAWKGMAIARLCARDGATLKRDLIALLGNPDFAAAQSGLGVALPRLWAS